jgi:hypothetical protein
LAVVVLAGYVAFKTEGNQNHNDAYQCNQLAIDSVVASLNKHTTSDLSIVDVVDPHERSVKGYRLVCEATIVLNNGKSLKRYLTIRPSMMDANSIIVSMNEDLPDNTPMNEDRPDTPNPQTASDGARRVA